MSEKELGTTEGKTDNQGGGNQPQQNQNQNQAQNQMPGQMNRQGQNPYRIYGQQQGQYGYQNPYQNNWQNQRYYGNDYSRNHQNNYNNYPNQNYYSGMGQPNGFGTGTDNGNHGEKDNPGTWKKVLLIVCLICVVLGLGGGCFYLGMKTEKKPDEKTKEAMSEAEEETKIGEVDIDDIKKNDNAGEQKAQEPEKTTGGNLTDVSEIVERIMPSVVSVNAVYTYTENYWGENYSQQYDGGGSGFIIGQNESELLIATNSHVVTDVEDLKVIFIDEKEADAMVKGFDNDLDVAVIAVDLEDVSEETKEKIAVAKLGDSTTLKAGQAVISIGNALLMGQSVTTGVISAVNMPVGAGYDEAGNQYGSDDRVMIQTTAFMNPGCSGGVLINASGEVVGINTMAISSDIVEGMCYAIPISDAIPVLDRLKEKEIRERLSEADSGYLGISCNNVGKQEAEDYGIPLGVYVREVYEGSAAEEAGLQKGDVIVALNGDSVKKMEELQEMLYYYPVGEKVELEIMRYEKGEYKSQTIVVRLGKRS